jgi:hypothetical protein
MKTTTTFKTITAIALFGALFTLPVMAQSGPGMGGPGLRNAAQSTPGASPRMGQGQGMGRGMGRQGRMGFGQSNTRGWSLMTPEERTAHQAKMRQVKTFDECKQVQNEQRTAMEARAKEKGVTLPTPRQNACENMKARGFIK